MVFRATLSNKVNFNPLESFPYLTLIHPREQSLSKLPYDLVKRTFYRKKSNREFRVIFRVSFGIFKIHKKNPRIQPNYDFGIVN